MLTVGSKRLDALTLCPIILATVEPLEGGGTGADHQHKALTSVWLTPSGSQEETRWTALKCDWPH